jgi:hypothetical protein
MMVWCFILKFLPVKLLASAPLRALRRRSKGLIAAGVAAKLGVALAAKALAHSGVSALPAGRSLEAALASGAPASLHNAPPGGIKFS